MRRFLPGSSLSFLNVNADTFSLALEALSATPYLSHVNCPIMPVCAGSAGDCPQMFFDSITFKVPHFSPRPRNKDESMRPSPVQAFTILPTTYPPHPSSLLYSTLFHFYPLSQPPHITALVHTSLLPHLSVPAILSLCDYPKPSTKFGNLLPSPIQSLQLSKILRHCSNPDP